MVMPRSGHARRVRLIQDLRPHSTRPAGAMVVVAGSNVRARGSTRPTAAGRRVLGTGASRSKADLAGDAALEGIGLAGVAADHVEALVPGRLGDLGLAGPGKRGRGDQA